MRMKAKTKMKMGLIMMMLMVTNVDMMAPILKHKRTVTRDWSVSGKNYISEIGHSTSHSHSVSVDD